MPRPKKKPAVNLSELARKTGITRQTLRQWQADGIDLADPAQLASRIEAMRRNAAPGSLSEARLRKVLLECERLEFQLERERGEWCQVTEAKAVIDLLDIVTAQIWKTAPREIPGWLDGVPTARMQRTLEDFVDNHLIPRFKAQIEAGLRRLREASTSSPSSSSNHE